MSRSQEKSAEQKTRPVASAGGVVRNVYGEIIVTRKRDGTCSLPKGKIKDEEQPVEAAIREIGEEAGVKKIDLVFLAPLESYARYTMTSKGSDGRSERKIIIMFLFQTNQSALHPTDPEHDARWVTVDEAIKLLTHSADKEFLLGARNRIL